MNNYLCEHKRIENAEITHTRIGDKTLNIFGGSYTILNNDEFLHEYYKDIIVAGKNEYLTEKQLENGVIAIDLDFRYNANVEKRLHDKHTVEKMIDILIEPLKDYYKFDKSSTFDVYVMEKPNVNILADGSLTKDGIHFIIGLNMNKIIKKEYRMTLVHKFEKENSYLDLPLINDWDSVIDEGVLHCSNNWQLYGSKKPANETYALTQHFTIGYDPVDKEFTMVENKILEKLEFEMLKQLSVRNNDRPKIELITNTPQKLNVVQTLLKNTEPGNDKIHLANELKDLLKIIQLNEKQKKIESFG